MLYNLPMRKFIEKYITRENILIFVTLLVVLYPILELEYLLGDMFTFLNIPRFTTIVKFIVLPLLGVMIFLLFEKNKKRAVIFLLGYGVLFGIYFVLHYLNADYLQYNMRLTTNFVFKITEEIIYFVTLLLPLAYVWFFNLLDLKENLIKKVMIGISCVTSIPIFLSNIFLFGESTYDGYTIANIFSWFSLPFNDGLNHPRYYATKFFFEEGNTIGIIMLMALPFLYYFLCRSKSIKEKILLSGLISVQSLAMIMLSTRIATYGAVLVPTVMLVVYVVLVIIKQEKFKSFFIVIPLVITLISGSIIPYSPAYQNQLLDATNHGFIKANEETRKEADDDRRGGEHLEEFSKEWIDHYVYMFEVYSFLVGVTPPIYYNEWYDYRHDPKFWVDLAFDYELEERVTGRQIQQIFTNYKYNPLTSYQKAMGIGYSTFMMGSILLEKDFVQQFYTLGYAGFVLLMLPWLVLFIYLGMKVVLGFKKGSWNYLNIVLMMSFSMALLGAYMSGHVIDEISTSLLIALCVGVLYKRLKNEYEK